MSCCANLQNVVGYSRRFVSLVYIFVVRTFNDEHTCSLMDRVFEQQHTTIAFIAGIISPKLVNHKRIIIPSDIIEDIKRELSLDIDYMMAWRAKERALKILRGRLADGYKKMPTYVYMLNSVYPNSHIRMNKSPDNRFMYLCVALHPFIRGFRYYRPVVIVDDSHLGGPYKETFISASILDGVDSENNSSGTWCFQQFKCAFSERDNMCVVSDRHESIIKVDSEEALHNTDEDLCKAINFYLRSSLASYPTRITDIAAVVIDTCDRQGNSDSQCYISDNAIAAISQVPVCKTNLIYIRKKPFKRNKQPSKLYQSPFVSVFYSGSKAKEVIQLSKKLNYPFKGHNINGPYAEDVFSKFSL
ncbi:putative AT-rich interactive domain-containing protein 1-like [Capsicum annuum]|nr:putative AT-rich interactive domain-containing protein 1-like [Capsicum annuum]